VFLKGNKWLRQGSRARGTIPIGKAIRAIVLRNDFEPSEARLLRRTVRRVLRVLPKVVREASSFRLVREGRYLSINAGNHLVFRTPAYTDDGKRQDWDLYLVWLRSARPPIIKPSEWRRISSGGFRLAPDCTNVQFTYDEALSFGPAEWNVFAKAAQMLIAKRSRPWPSNVHL
jgi:hypothetical protein